MGLGYYRLRFCIFYLLHNSTAQVALRNLLLFAGGLLLSSELLEFDLVQLSFVHQVNFIEARVDLIQRNVTLVFLIDNSKYGLILLFVNCELFLHFKGCAWKQPWWVVALLLLFLATFFDGASLVNC